MKSGPRRSIVAATLCATAFVIALMVHFYFLAEDGRCITPEGAEGF